MNRKKFISLALSLALFSGAFCICHADDSDSKEKEKVSKADLREIFKTRIEKNDFGDLAIVKFPEVDLKEIQSKSQALTQLMAMLLAYVDSDIDYVRLNKLMAKYSGADKNASGGLPIRGLMNGMNKYLANKSMGLSKTNFSAVNVRQKLEDGVPVFCWLATGAFYDRELTDRYKERKTFKSAEEWQKELRKQELKKLRKGRMVSDALCIGFNPATNEYLIIGVARNNPVWMTEREIKSVLTGAYILRY